MSSLPERMLLVDHHPQLAGALPVGQLPAVRSPAVALPRREAGRLHSVTAQLKNNVDALVDAFWGVVLAVLNHVGAGCSRAGRLPITAAAIAC